MNSASNLHSAWSELLVGALAAAGVRDVVVSPGSRSTPLVLAAAKETRLTCRVIVDERSAAFFALGQARASGMPTALICTSGSAVAHYFPAIVEASAAFVPLLVLSADRPWEDRATGASQTIDQIKMFGDYVRHFADLGPPDASPAALRAVARIAAQCVAATLGPTPGPVQLNAQFRKPLEPVNVATAEPWADALQTLRERGAPQIFSSRSTVDARAVDLVADAFANAKAGLIVAGPSMETLENKGDPRLALARATGFPILAECTSQLRFGSRDDDIAIAGGFDTYLRSAAFRRAHCADVILELGAAPTSSAYAAYLSEQRCPRIVVAAHGHSDPRGDATAVVHSSPSDVCAALVTRLGIDHAAARRERTNAWRSRFAQAEAATWRRAAEEDREDALNEASIARAIVDAVPEGGALVVGNSNPVRDLDTFAPPTSRRIRVVHQRGAAGIDGLVSGAAGFVTIANVPTILYVGDLTFLHDVGGLAALHHVSAPLVIVMVQNEGGRIFEELPIHGAGTAPGTFEKFFATSQKVDFSRVAAAFGISFLRTDQRAELVRALSENLARAGCAIIEARVPPHDGSERRMRFRADIARVLAATEASR